MLFRQMLWKTLVSDCKLSKVGTLVMMLDPDNMKDISGKELFNFTTIGMLGILFYVQMVLTETKVNKQANNRIKMVLNETLMGKNCENLLR